MKKQTLIIALAIATNAAFAQTATPMAQYSGNQLIYNPGFAGAHDLLSANLSFRTLWSGIANSPTLISLNAHGPFSGLRHSVGLICQRETLGPQSVHLVNLTYSHKIHVGQRNFLSLGVQAGLFNSITDWNKVTFVRHPDDPGYGHDERWTSNKFDVGVGAHFQARDFYVGMSARHLTAPTFDKVHNVNGDDWYSQVRRQFFLMGGYNFFVNHYFDIRPRLLMRYKHTVPLAVSAGVDIVYLDRVSFGLNFASGQQALTLALAGEIVEGLRIGYAYDINFGVLAPFQRGSHELFVSYFMPLWNRINDQGVRQPFR
jgi:type IX secretion system PorP/SprF family membrane protein